MGIMDILGGAVKTGLNAATGGIVGNAISGLFGNSQQDINDRAERFAESQQKEQIKGAKELADYNQMLGMQNFEGTGYEAQVRQMKEAGLNPALIYGKGGGGGGTMGGSMGMGMPTAGSAPDQSAGAKNAMDIAMMGAQLQLVQAQTEKTKAEAQNEGGVKRENIAASTASLTQGINNAKAQEELTTIQSNIAKYQEVLAGQTITQAIQTIDANLQRDLGQAKSAMIQANVDEATQQNKIKIIKQEAIAGILNNAYTKAKTEETGSNIQVNQAQINKWAADIIQNQQTITQGEKRTAADVLKSTTTDEVLRNLNGIYREDAKKAIEMILNHK